MPDLIVLIKAVGYYGVWGIIFSETGILFGILLPGDMLLFAVGVLASQGVFSITKMAIGCFVAAFIGNIVGYEVGQRLGLPFVKKYCSGIVTEEHLRKTQYFFERYGRSGLVIARFIPIARTIAPFLAGIGRMEYSIFLMYSFVGALMWGAGLPILGYYLGGFIPPEMIDYILLPIIAIIIFILIWPWLHNKMSQKNN